MPWVNLDDKFPNHPKVDGLSNGAFRLHVSGICYCNSYLTDGRISLGVAPRLMPGFQRKYLDELLTRNLWLPAAGGYEIHDYLHWNKSRQVIEQEQDRLHEMRSKAGRKGADARWHSQ